MSIFTHSFPQFIKEQLKLRRQILETEKGDRFKKIEGNDTLPAGAYYTNTVEKQCVIRLCSGVDLNGIGEKNILKGTYEQTNWTGAGLAINWILAGGVRSPDLPPRAGVTGKSNKAYGDKSTRSDAGDGYGIVPMPGIVDASIKVKSAYGSLRDAEVNFVCHNRRQLEI